MRKLTTSLCLILLVLLGSAEKSFALLQCPGSYNQYTWDNCFGMHTFANGDRYFGEFRNGNYNGQGTFTWLKGERYVGEWRDGKRHGQGTEAYSDGSKFVGEYRNDYRWNGVWYDRAGAQKGTYSNGGYTGGTSASQTTTSTSNQSASSSSALPKCGVWSGAWNKCHGTRIFHNAPEGKFVGEFRNGNRWNGKMHYSYGLGHEKGVYTNGVYKSL